MYKLGVINNKGGVGKTTTAINLAMELSKSYRVLIVDADPQSNASSVLLGDELAEIWSSEDHYMDGGYFTQSDYDEMLDAPRSLHFLLKPIQDGFNVGYNKSIYIRDNLSLIPSRLSLGDYEKPLSERYAGLFTGDTLSHRTFAGISDLIKSHEKDFDIVIIDMSPSLGILNKSIIMYCDGVIIPCQPNIFSMYGIRNTLSKLNQWVNEFEKLNVLYKELLKDKHHRLPQKNPKVIGYVVNYFGKDIESAQPHVAAFSKQMKSLYHSVLNVDNIHKPLGGDFFGGNAIDELRNAEQVANFIQWHDSNKQLPDMTEYALLVNDIMQRIKS